jgi:hypothetical protein
MKCAGVSPGPFSALNLDKSNKYSPNDRGFAKVVRWLCQGGGEALTDCNVEMSQEFIPNSCIGL